MQSASSKATINFAIISADYKLSGSTKEKKIYRLDVVEALNEKLDKVRNLREQYFEPQNVLILWKDNPDEHYLTKYLGHSNDNLIMQFCKRIAAASKTKPVQLFIDKPETLFEENKTMFTVLERLIAIWRETNLIPILLEHDFLSLDNDGLLGKEGWQEEWKAATRFVDRLKASHNAVKTTKKEQTAYFEKVKDYYEHFYTSIETLIAILSPLEKQLRKKESFSELPKTDFIHTYFMWQAGIYTSVEKAQEALNQNIPVSTWYRYADNFENNMIYEEYTVAYWRYLFLGDDDEMKEQNPSYKRDGYLFRPKKGNTPDCIEYLCFFNKEERLSFFEPCYEQKNPYLEFDDIHSLIDVERAKSPAYLQFKNLRSRKTGKNPSKEHYGKTLIKEKLAKFEYEPADLYPIFSKKSPYYKQVQEFEEESMNAFLSMIEADDDPEEQEWQDFLRSSMEESDDQ